jgi:hypothetical protein
VEELATKRKQMLNLDGPGTSHANTFDILNHVDDDTLVQTAKELDIILANNEGCREQISTIKAEERTRALIAEANYKIHLANLWHKEGVQDDDILDLSIIDNDARNVTQPSESRPNQGKTRKNQKENKKKKKLNSYSRT